MGQQCNEKLYNIFNLTFNLTWITTQIFQKPPQSLQKSETKPTLKSTATISNIDMGNTSENLNELVPRSWRSVQSVTRSALRIAASVWGEQSIAVMTVRETSVDLVKKLILKYGISNITTWQFTHRSLNFHLDVKCVPNIPTMLLKCIVNLLVFQSLPNAKIINNTKNRISGKHLKKKKTIAIQ